MRYLSQLLNRRGLTTVPLPLWRLKLTDEEYHDLRTILKNESELHTGRMPFGDCAEECALFFAEYWRREYKNGAHSKLMVYRALESSRIHNEGRLNLLFYDTAIRGAKALGIKFYQGDKGEERLNTMLYQGGLPMQLVTQPNQNGIWAEFLRRLVFHHIDFSELNLGIIAQHDRGLRAFCEQMIDAADKQQYLLMPFFCQNEFDPWYQFLVEHTGEDRRRMRQLHPFTLGWTVTMDDIERRFSCKYYVRGSQKLASAFINQNHLPQDYFSAEVHVGGQLKDSFDFYDGFCRYDVRSVHPYHNGDVVELLLGRTSEPHLSDSLDFSVPQLLYLNKESIYELGNRLGKQASAVVMGSAWEVEDDSCIATIYTWMGISYKVIKLEADFEGSITLKSADGTITLSEDSELDKTIAVSRPLYLPSVVESVYDTATTKFAISHKDDEGNSVTRRHGQTRFRSKWSTVWSPIAPYGEIFARIIDADGNYITPMRIVNVGQGLKVTTVSSDKDVCKIEVAWPHGNVFCKEGSKGVGEEWIITRQDCAQNSHHIHFVLTPKENSKNAFILTLRAPFKDFSIYDAHGTLVDHDVYIPYADIDKYQYHLVGQDVRRYSYGHHVRALRWTGDNLWIVENGQRLRKIPSDGSLLQLFDSREAIRATLEHTAKDITHASIHVHFDYGIGKSLDFEIKDSPYRIRQDGDRLTIFDKGWQPYHYKGTLKLLKIDDPSHETVTLSYDTNQGYVLPQVVKEWGKIMVLGRTRGRLLPKLVQTGKPPTPEERKANLLSIRAHIKSEMQTGKLGDNVWQQADAWFRRTQSDDISASSAIHLWALGQNPQALVFFAFMKYATTSEEERDLLQRQFLTLSRDLAFQWYWLCPIMRGQTMAIVNNYLGQDSLQSTTFKHIYVLWSMTQGEHVSECLAAINQPEAYFAKACQCMVGLQPGFELWMQELFILSMESERGNSGKQDISDIIKSIITKKPQELMNIENSGLDIAINQDDIDLKPETTSFFSNFNRGFSIKNEVWLMTRVRAVAWHWKLKGKNTTSLFEKDDEIRRSIIFCMNACHDEFIIALNNELKERR